MGQKNKKAKQIEQTIEQNNSYRKNLIGILIITFLVFVNSIVPEFVQLDDPAYIIDNPFIKSLSFDNIKTIFTSFYNANYHPITTLSYAIEFKLFGLKATGYHYTNIAIHLLNTSLVFILTLKISKRKEIATICALLFGVHPMHVESVAWISERKDLLYSMFYLMALIYYYEYIHNNKKKSFLLVLFFFALSLLSKSAAITLPLVLCAFDYYLARGLNKKVILEKIPFFALSVLFGIITILSQDAAGALNSELMPIYSLIERFFVASYATCYYLWQLFFPFSLSALHYAPKEIPAYFYIMPLILLALAYSVYKLKTIKREIVFGLTFYFLAICLTIQIIPVGYAIVSERYSYLPYIGLFFIIGHFYVAVIEGKINLLKHIKPYLNYAFVALIIFYSILTFNRNQAWSNSTTLFRDVTQKYPKEEHAHFTLGKNLYASREIEPSILEFNQAIKLNPKFVDAYFFRGNIYFDQQKYPEASQDYKTAISLKPDHEVAIYNLGICYISMGKYTEAIETITKSISIAPNEYMYQSRGTAYFYLTKYKEAIDNYSFALKINPQLSESFFNRGVCYSNMQQNKLACDDWNKALSLGITKAKELIDAYCK